MRRGDSIIGAWSHQVTHPQDGKGEPLTASDVAIRSLGLDDQQFDHIVHLSDIHIPIHLHLDRKAEYQTVFEQLYQHIQLLQRGDDRSPRRIAIVITGDLLHVKLNIEAETIMMTRHLIESLVKLAPTIVIIGNHDFTENNLERTDSISAICHGIDVHFLKYTGVYRLGNVLFAFSSLFDNKFIKRKDIPMLPTGSAGDPAWCVYHLFHGTVIGPSTVTGPLTGWGTDPTPRCVTSRVTMRCCSGISTNTSSWHLMWPTPAVWCNKTSEKPSMVTGCYYGAWTLTNHNLSPSPTNMSTLMSALTKGWSPIGINCNRTETSDCGSAATTVTPPPPNAKRLRLNSNANFTVHEIRSGSPIAGSSGTNGLVQPTATTVIDHHQLEDTLLRQQVKPELYQEVLALHETLRLKCGTQAGQSTWNLVSLKFKNLFAYGGDHVNTIDFINGIHNICSPNMTGKSSIMYIIMFALYDQISVSGAAKKANLIHNGKTQGFIELTLSHNGQLYLIEKVAKQKGGTGGTGGTAGAASVIFDTNFYRLPEYHNLNGKTAQPTNQIIAGYVGDFNLFNTHHVISTKLGHSLVNMAPADKLKHFHRLCDTDRYDVYLKKVSEDKKAKSAQLDRLLGQLHSWQAQIGSGATEAEQQDELTQLHDQLRVVIEQLRCSDLAQSQLETQRRVIADQINQLVQQRRPAPKVRPPNEAAAIDLAVEQDQLILDQLERDLDVEVNETSQALRQLITTYQSHLKVSSVVDADPVHVQQRLEQHRQSKPTGVPVQRFGPAN